MYEHDNKRYFIVDGHVLFWDATEDNVANDYGEGFHPVLLRLPPQPLPRGVRVVAG